MLITKYAAAPSWTFIPPTGAAPAFAVSWLTTSKLSAISPTKSMFGQRRASVSTSTFGQQGGTSWGIDWRGYQWRYEWW